MTNVKWLASIEVVAEPFTGYQHERGYRFRASEDDPGEPLSRMRPRSLLAPPGIPDFMTRRRTLAAGRHVLEGRAWSGLGTVERVDVSCDGGATWAAAALGEPAGLWAWRRWGLDWEAVPGEHELLSRATDSTGATQPLDPPWNVGGYANNAVQRVEVTVT
jgi:hypothetical protein